MFCINSKALSRISLAAVLGISIAAYAGEANAQSTPAQASNNSASTTATPSSVPAANKPARRTYRRRQRAAVQQQTSTNTPAVKQPLISPEQRQRDAQILELQKEQQAQTAKANATVINKAITERQRQQDETRIQDAPGPGDQPIPGAPAVAPAQPADQPRIQDAPGPAQTLPKPPPDSTTSAPPQS